MWVLFPSLEPETQGVRFPCAVAVGIQRLWRCGCRD